MNRGYIENVKKVRVQSEEEIGLIKVAVGNTF
jgi:hypothetical protein